MTVIIILTSINVCIYYREIAVSMFFSVRFHFDQYQLNWKTFGSLSPKLDRSQFNFDGDQIPADM